MSAAVRESTMFSRALWCLSRRALSLVTEVFQVAALLFGGIALLDQGLLHLGLLCVMIGLYNTKLPALMQLVLAGSLLFALAL